MKTAVLLIVLLIAGMVFVSGCVTTSDIQSQEEVSEAVSDIGEDVGDLTDALEEIDQTLGS